MERVAASGTRKTNVWIAATLHRYLRTMVADPTLPEDLLFWLRMEEIRLSSLADRKEDLSLSLLHFNQKFGNA